MTRRRATSIGIALVLFQAVVMSCIAFLALGGGNETLDRMLATAQGFTPRSPQTPQSALATFQPSAASVDGGKAAANTVPAHTNTPKPQSATPERFPAASNEAITTYKVKPGDNLFRISLRFGLTVEEIMAANNLTGDSFVRAGQTLVIPDAPPAATPESAGPEPATEVPSQAAALVTLEPSQTSLPPLPPTVNGVPIAEIAVLPRDTRRNIRAIFKSGQDLGNNARAFSKVGDSTIENPFFLARFDEGPYNLGEFAHLQGVIDYYAGSFGRQGMSVKRGLHSWTVMDPAWADKRQCQANEGPMECEFRLHRPSIVLIRLGSNDAGVPAYFEQNVRQIVAYAVENGVIPILGTKADRIEGSGNINNEILRHIAADFSVPLWDFDRVAGTMPGRGLDVDNVHLTTFYAHDYTSPLAMERGHAMHNLTALIVLDAIRNEVIQDTP
jgi:LysM repeat protein